MGVPIILSAAFERAQGERLLSAEKLALSLPQIFQGLHVDFDLAYRSSTGFFAIVVRLDPADGCLEARARMQFWCARAGGIVTAVSTLNNMERAIFDARLERCDLKIRGVASEMLSKALDRIVTSAGAPADRPRGVTARPILTMDVGGPGWQGVLYDGGQQTLFIPGNISPPVGDEIALALRIAGVEEPVKTMARVTEVRTPGDSGPGMLAGFTLQLQSLLPVLSTALEQAQPPQQVARPTTRVGPRYPGKAPVKVIVPPSPESEERAPKEEEPKASAPMPLERIEYDTEEELAADYATNLSQGGAFIRSSQPQPVGSQLMLEIWLPGSVTLKTPANVVYTNETGMGVKFELDSAGSETLSAVIARISARPKRALVVDDDLVVRKMMTKALQERGYEVLTANDGTTGIEIVTEELLSLDLLVTDVNMPNMDGEAFVRTIRQAGGENELAIVVITANLEPGMGPRLQKVGADVVLQKTLGPKVIAQAADEALERKRGKRD